MECGWSTQHPKYIHTYVEGDARAKGLLPYKDTPWQGDDLPVKPHSRHSPNTDTLTPISLQTSNMRASLLALLHSHPTRWETSVWPFPDWAKAGHRTGVGSRRGAREEGGRAGLDEGTPRPNGAWRAASPGSEARKSRAVRPESTEQPARAELRRRWAGPCGQLGRLCAAVGLGQSWAEPELNWASLCCSAGCTRCQDRCKHEQNVVRNGNRGEAELCFSMGCSRGADSWLIAPQSIQSCSLGCFRVLLSVWFLFTEFWMEREQQTYLLQHTYILR